MNTLNLNIPELLQQLCKAKTVNTKNKYANIIISRFENLQYTLDCSMRMVTVLQRKDKFAEESILLTLKSIKQQLTKELSVRGIKI